MDRLDPESAGGAVRHMETDRRAGVRSLAEHLEREGELREGPGVQECPPGEPRRVVVRPSAPVGIRGGRRPSPRAVNLRELSFPVVEDTGPPVQRPGLFIFIFWK
ncbi:hypothetical protein [Planomonospora venezuelensis]|uniref:Uncharacterized protein n=1 Tax=Planomonospora venezuelensis TaxID=1999 RepID=A0A841DAF8_PLAVE|nr:hypothetical protein [Planomonospora venezuelensis]MBB5967161.1 hypothetical protein [Planomonospora venezuelensis]